MVTEILIFNQTLEIVRKRLERVQAGWDPQYLVARFIPILLASTDDFKLYGHTGILPEVSGSGYDDTSLVCSLLFRKLGADISEQGLIDQRRIPGTIWDEHIYRTEDPNIVIVTQSAAGNMAVFVRNTHPQNPIRRFLYNLTN